MAVGKVKEPSRRDFVAQFVPLTGYKKLIVWFTWCFFVLIPFNHVRVLSNYYFQSIFSGYFEVGYEWLNRPRDISNFEWETFRVLFLYYAIVCTVHSLLLKTCALFKNKDFTKVASIAFSVIALSHPFHMFDLFIIVVHIVASFLIIKLRSRAILWTWVLSIITGMHFKPGLVIWWRSGDIDRSKELQLFTLLICYLKIISFGLEYQMSSTCKGSEKSGKASSQTFEFMDYLSYVFYPPLFLNGPILTYDQFMVGSGNSKIQPGKILRGAFSVILYWFLVDIAFHYLYSSSMSTQPDILRKLNGIQTASVVWIELQFFYHKYLVLYGAPGVFLEVDGMQDPGPPICISSLCTFAAMWRYFDKGLYSFLKKYIYVPLGGSRNGLLVQTMASAGCFAFISLWHGADWNYNVLWGITNWLGICFETYASQCYWLYRDSINELPVGGDRLAAFAGGINIAFLVLSNAIFLDGYPAAKIYFYNIFIKGFPICPLILLFILYCGSEAILHYKKDRIY